MRRGFLLFGATTGNAICTVPNVGIVETNRWISRPLLMEIEDEDELEARKIAAITRRNRF
jgi:hypothetical protein